MKENTCLAQHANNAYPDSVRRWARHGCLQCNAGVSKLQCLGDNVSLKNVESSTFPCSCDDGALTWRLRSSRRDVSEYHVYGKRLLEETLEQNKACKIGRWLKMRISHINLLVSHSIKHRYSVAYEIKKLQWGLRVW